MTTQVTVCFNSETMYKLGKLALAAGNRGHEQTLKKVIDWAYERAESGYCVMGGHPIFLGDNDHD